MVFYMSHDLGQPSGVDTDGTYVYVVGRGGYITIFDLDFNVVGELGFFNGNLRGHTLAADSKGNLYIFPHSCQRGAPVHRPQARQLNRFFGLDESVHPGG